MTDGSFTGWRYCSYEGSFYKIGDYSIYSLGSDLNDENAILSPVLLFLIETLCNTK